MSENTHIEGSTYFLFGKTAVFFYRDNGFEELMEMVEQDDTQFDVNLYVYHPEHCTPSDLLGAYIGFGDFEVITREEWQRLSDYYSTNNL